MSKKLGLLGSVHQTHEGSLGAVLFPISLFLCAGIFWRIDPLLFQGAALILGLADGLAGVGGQKFGQRSYRITGHKTIEGSFIFFVITFIILLVFGLYHFQQVSLSRLLAMTVAALFLTGVEGTLSKGWDNLLIPLCSALALSYLML